MKALAVERGFGIWNAEASAAVYSDRVAQPWCLPVTLLTDSAFVRKGMPLFVPDFAMGWELEIVPCLTVCRLGKTIPARFARRYLGEIGLVGRLLPPEAEAGSATLTALASNFDGALCLGERFAIDGTDAGITISLDGVGEISLSAEDMNLENTIALLSRYMILKTGDLILPCRTGLRVSARPGAKVKATLDGKPALNLKIK